MIARLRDAAIDLYLIAYCSVIVALTVVVTTGVAYVLGRSIVRLIGGVS